jgi:hypothetical protein
MSDEQSARPPDGIEHRRAPRYPVAPYGGAVSVVGAQLINVNAYGAMIESLVPMETDAVMPLRLIVSGSKVDVEARVANCYAAAGEKRRVFRIGLEFVTIPAEARDRLAEVLKTAAPQTSRPAAP